MKNYVFIPAKSDSIRVPNKNFLDINGKKLIEYTIDTALNINSIDEVILSVNSRYTFNHPKIKIHKRNKIESNSKLSVIQLINLWLQAQNIDEGNLILLQPTHPFRNLNEINRAFKYFLKRKNFNSLASFNKVDYKVFNSKEDLIDLKNDVQRYDNVINGIFYFFKIKNRKIGFENKTLLFETKQSEFQVNIDNPFEFRLAEILSVNFKNK